MAKGYLIGDIHLGLHQLNLDKWLDIHRMYFYDFLIPYLKENYKKGDKIFILGDLFDNRTQLQHKITSFTLDLFNYLEENEYDVLIIGGNHDYFNNWDSEHTPLRILEKHKNVELFNKPSVYTFNNKKILLLPWDKHETQLKEMKKWAGKVDYLFTHSDLRGAKTGIKNTLMVGNTIADYVGFPKVYASHIHIYQQLENFKFLGSPFHMDRNDKGNKKGLTIIDFDNDTDIFIPNNITPEFKTLEIVNENDLEKLDTIINSESNESKKDDFIDIVINNSVLLNSKEAKRKIEEISKTKNISAIKYVDDTSVDNGIENINLEDIGMNISTEDLIREYVKNQQVESELKNKFLLILEDTIKICKNNNSDEI
jgi:DNA repair exonuclease SbcCD nuclease subunit